MTDTNFLISGTAIISSAQGPLKMPKRKFYNAAYFNDNQYHHEIANHYRDYKLRRRIRQRKRKVNVQCYGRFEAGKDLYLDCQQELPMAVHMFPSFEKIYTPRRRPKLCEQRRPVLNYNDTINRIQSSKANTEFLINLGKKQVDRLKHQKQCTKCSSHAIQTKDFPTANQLIINKSKQNRRRSLGKLEGVDHLRRQQQQFALNSSGGVIRPFATKTQRLEGGGRDISGGGNVGAETLKYYLQLATDYYQQGFLENIKYLENLRERNQLRRQKHLQLQQQQQQKKLFTFDGLSNTTTTTTSILKLNSSDIQIERITDASLSSSGIKQQPIKENNPILWRKRQSINQPTVNDFPLSKSKNRNCAIRVNIQPQTANASCPQGNFFFGLKKEIYGKKKTICESKDFNSMNDYLNGNLEHSQSLQQEQQHLSQQLATFYHNTSVNNQNISEKVLLLDTLIDNLRELDIQENRTNLPRITLTDYTHKYPNDTDTNFQTQDLCNQNNKRLHTCLIKQSTLDCSNLGIPLDTQYHSEARPP